MIQYKVVMEIMKTVLNIYAGFLFVGTTFVEFDVERASPRSGFCSMGGSQFNEVGRLNFFSLMLYALFLVLFYIISICYADYKVTRKRATGVLKMLMILLSVLFSGTTLLLYEFAVSILQIRNGLLRCFDVWLLLLYYFITVAFFVWVGLVDLQFLLFVFDYDI